MNPVEAYAILCYQSDEGIAHALREDEPETQPIRQAVHVALQWALTDWERLKAAAAFQA